MQHYLKNIISLATLIPVIMARIMRQKKFADNLLYPILQNYNGALDAEDLHKIKLYGTTIPALMGDAFCTLRGIPMSLPERTALTYFAVLTGLFDDLFDRTEMTDSQIQTLLETTDNSKTKIPKHKLIVSIYQKGLVNASQPTKAQITALRVFEAQSAARTQKEDATELENLKKICIEKGGSSMLFYRCALSENADTQDEKIVFQLGAAGQMANDIFDIYKDLQENIHTCANKEVSINELKKNFLQQMQIISQLIQKSSFSNKNKKHFAKYCALILSRALVAIDHLQKTTKNTNGQFNPKQNTRTELICDMEKPSNILKMLHYASKWLTTF